MDPRSTVPLAVLLQQQAQEFHQLGVLAQQMGDIQQRINKRNRSKPRKWWVGPLLVPRLRQEVSQYYVHLQIMRAQHPEAFKRELRMPVELFDEILEKVQDDISAISNPRALEPGLKLSLVLKYLAHGPDQVSMYSQFLVSSSAICKMIVPVCQAIQRRYVDEVFKTPTTEEEWLQVAKDFEDRWQVPHALGALDGKHFRIRCPPKTGSLYYCVYKKHFSVVLMALVDAKYRFIWVDVGGIGHQSDAQIYNASSLREHLNNGDLNIPRPAILSKDPPKPAPYCLPAAGEEPQDDDEVEMIDPPTVPYFLIGDDAFALSTNLQKPLSKDNMTYRERVYSYRLSRARRCVENAFGILVHRFRILYNELLVGPEKAQCIIHTCIVLHNLLRTRYPTATLAAADVEQPDGSYIRGEWRSTVATDEDEPEPPGLGLKQTTKNAKALQSYLMDYFADPTRGAVSWQDNKIFHTGRHPGRRPNIRVAPR